MAMTKNEALDAMSGSIGMSYPASSGVTYYNGALVGLDVTTGKVVLWDDNANYIWLGFVQSVQLLPDDEVTVNVAGEIVRNRTVTGVVDQTSVGDLVYADDDGPAFTLTPTANVDAVGVLYRATGTDTGDVCLFSPKEYITL